MQYKIAIVGEAWGAEEEKARAPFIGASGQELTRMLSEAGIHRADCYLTNVFNLRPDNNDLEKICVPKGQGGLEDMPAIKAGKYPRAELRSELNRLYRELSETNPNVILALGGTAAWALLLTTGISKIRGTVSQTPFGLASKSNIVGFRGYKVLPAFHPAAVLRDWSLRAVTVLDFAKAARESAFPEIRRPERIVYIEPDLADMEWFYEKHLVNAAEISEDIETSGDQITCVGFAPHAGLAMVVPFVDPRKSGNSYWPTIEMELKAWALVRKVNLLPNKKIFQNGLYDLNFEWSKYGLRINGEMEDTMLLHHSLQPESQKGLGFLGSVYTSEMSWKLLGKRGLTETIKRDA